jgi:hypothetical protein
MFRGGQQTTDYSRDEDTISGLRAGQRGLSSRFFDIVNGFLIDAVVHWCVVQGLHANVSLTDVESG